MLGGGGYQGGGGDRRRGIGEGRGAIETEIGRGLIQGRLRCTIFVCHLSLRSIMDLGCPSVRGDKAMQLLENCLKFKESELFRCNFSENRCFGFGIQDHIDLGIK
ncbi:60S ribosomal protein L11-1 [Artemisia annua]|uniref:60S ribosomal protein L11-1 n=1 Tax=Artemisia annua TaxID=35608 RepID=A0A2U1K9Q0_ARTAN|nr:60S ribosomal protein L11-1 [Artemisia annua]